MSFLQLLIDWHDYNTYDSRYVISRDSSYNITDFDGYRNLISRLPTLTLVKIDAEGSEFSILWSALPLLQHKKIKIIFVEIVPARVNNLTPYSNVLETLDAIERFGYHISLGWPNNDPLNFEKVRYPNAFFNWEIIWSLMVCYIYICRSICFFSALFSKRINNTWDVC